MTQPQRRRNTAFEKLNVTGLSLADASQDIRNRKVIDRHGDEIGHVSDLFIDQDERKVRMLEIRAGGFLGIGDRHALLPVEAITRVTKDECTSIRRASVSHTRPSMIPLLSSMRRLRKFGSRIGLSPYRGAGYLYPEFPPSRERPITDRRSKKVANGCG